MKPARAAIVAVAFFGVVAAIVLPMPVKKTVTRSRVIAAPLERVRAEVADLRTWDAWLVPFSNSRVAGSSTYEEDGGVWRWKSGDGRALGLRRLSESGDTLVFELLGGAQAQETLSFAVEDGGTRVEWRHDVVLSGPAKLVPLIESPDSVVGPILEKDLEALGRRF